jgi:hypothetical protein
LEELEERAVPTTSPFFLDQNHALWAATGTGTFVNTGGVGVSLAVGLDSAGNQFAAVRDGNNRVFLYDQGSWIDTGGYALELVAGHNEVFTRDGNSHVMCFQFYGLTNQAWTDTGGFALSLQLGQVTLPYFPNPDGGSLVYRDFDVLTVRDGNNRLYDYAPVKVRAIPPLTIYTMTWTDTSGYATQFTVGYKGETVIRDGNNQVFVFQPTFSPVTPTAGAWTDTGGFAVDLDVGKNQNGNDIIAVRDSNNQVSVCTLSPTPNFDPPTPTWHATDLSNITQLAAGFGQVFGLDASNQLWQYSTTTAQSSNTGGYATLIRVTAASATANQVSMIDGQNVLNLYTGSFTDTGFTVTDVRGFTGRSN